MTWTPKVGDKVRGITSLSILSGEITNIIDNQVTMRDCTGSRIISIFKLGGEFECAYTLDEGATAPSADPINPGHYRAHPSGVECIDIIEYFSHNVAAAMGYLWRAGKKTPDPTEDFKKAIWHIERELKRLGAEKK